MATLAGKRVVFVIAFRDFRDEELLEPKGILEGEGARCEIASSALGTATGMLGAEVAVDRLYTAIKAAEQDAVVFVGGAGAAEYWDDRAAHNLARDTVKAGRVLGAICFAPSTLANAGLLEGRRATAFKTRQGHLKTKGALVSGEPVVTDGKLVTADGPSSAKAFGKALVVALGA